MKYFNLFALSVESLQKRATKCCMTHWDIMHLTYYAFVGIRLLLISVALNANDRQYFERIELSFHHLSLQNIIDSKMTLFGPLALIFMVYFYYRFEVQPSFCLAELAYDVVIRNGRQHKEEITNEPNEPIQLTMIRHPKVVMKRLFKSYRKLRSNESRMFKGQLRYFPCLDTKARSKLLCIVWLSNRLMTFVRLTVLLCASVMLAYCLIITPPQGSLGYWQNCAAFLDIYICSILFVIFLQNFLCLTCALWLICLAMESHLKNVFRTFKLGRYSFPARSILCEYSRILYYIDSLNKCILSRLYFVMLSCIFPINVYTITKLFFLGSTTPMYMKIALSAIMVAQTAGAACSVMPLLWMNREWNRNLVRLLLPCLVRVKNQTMKLKIESFCSSNLHSSRSMIFTVGSLEEISLSSLLQVKKYILSNTDD